MKIFNLLLLITISYHANCFQGSFQISQKSNYQIYQNSTDELFIGSLEGINIYDGRNVKRYDSSNSNMTGKITHSDFFEDEYGDIWFANYEAIHKYDYRRDDFEVIIFNNPYTQSEIKQDYKIIKLDENHIWVIAHTFLFLYNYEANCIEKWHEIDCNNYHSFSIEQENNSYNLYVVGQLGAKIITLDQNWNTCFTSYLNNDVNRASTLKNHNLLLLGTADGKLNYYSTVSHTLLKSVELGNGIINKIDNLSNNEIIINQSKNGIYHYNIENGSKKYLLEGSTIGLENAIYTTHQLKNNILWYCIEGRGCFKKDLNEYSFANQIINVVKDEKIGQIITSEDNILASVLGKPPVQISPSNIIQPSKINIKINAILPINKHQFLYSSGKKLFKFNGKSTVEIKEKSKIDLQLFYRLRAFNKSSYLLNNKSNIYTLNLLENEYTLIKLRNQQFESNTIIGLEKIEDFYISSIEETQLCSFTIFNDSILIKNKYDIHGDLKAVHELKDSFYVSTRYGLFICDKNSNDFRPIIDNNNLLKQTIYSILSQDNGVLWLSSNNGIIKYNPKTTHSFLFTSAHGLLGNEFNTYSYFKDSNGKFYFGGQSGLVSFHPDSIQLSNAEPSIHLSNFQVNGIDYEKQSSNNIHTIALPFDQNRLSFGFHAIDYSYGTTKTKYKMSSINDDWILNKNTSGIVNYPSLSPGKYTFSILGANTDGVWSKTPREIHITIHPPWYATWWARSLAILVLGGTVYLTIRSYYKRQIREKELELREANLQIAKQKALSKERTRIAGEMHDDLGGGLTTIRFLSQKALRNAKDQSQKNLIQKISTNSEALVNNMSEIIWAMNSRFDSLNSLISFCRRYAHEYLEDHEVSLKFMVSGNTKGVQISGSERRNIFLALKEALHNVVKHAKATEVKISFENNEHLQIQIADNGIGFKDSNEFGNGISNMTKRIERIGGHLNIDSNNGTTISIVLPMNSS